MHDLGRAREFTYGAEIARSEEGRLLGHVELTLRLLAPRYPASLARERRLALEHCILTHHGADATGSGQRLASAEAIALYRCNALDAHLKSAFEHGPAPRGLIAGHALVQMVKRRPRDADEHAMNWFRRRRAEPAGDEAIPQPAAAATPPEAPVSTPPPAPAAPAPPPVLRLHRLHLRPHRLRPRPHRLRFAPASRLLRFRPHRLRSRPHRPAPVPRRTACGPTPAPLAVATRTPKPTVARVGAHRSLAGAGARRLSGAIALKPDGGAAASSPAATAVLDPRAAAATLEPPGDGQRDRDQHGDRSSVRRPTGLSTATRSGRSGRRIGEVVVDLGFADRQAVEQAVLAARSQRKPTGQVLVEQGVLRQDQLARVVAERFGLDYIDLSVYEPDMGAVNLLSAEAIKRYQAVPVSFIEDGSLLLAMADPTNILSIDDIAMITNRRVRVAAASAEDVNLLAGAPRAPGGLDRRHRRGRRARVAGDVALRRGRPGRPDHQARALDHRPGGAAGRLGHPRQPRGGRHAACCSASTACSTRRRRCAAGWRRGWSRASRSWPTSTSPSAARPRTDG